MSKKKEDMRTNNIHIGGNVGPGAAVGTGTRVQAENIAGRDVIKDESTHIDVFAEIYTAIEAQLPADAASTQAVKEAVDVIKSENEKGEEANETSLKFSFRMLAQMAPDIFEVAVNTLINPVHGISTVVQKVAQKAKDEHSS